MHRPKELKRQRLEVQAPAELLYEVVASAGEVLEDRGREKVVAFEAQARGKKIKTVELVTLEPGLIKYRWMKGPLPFVEEEIEIAPRNGHSELTYTGRFATGRGLVECVVGLVWVKRVFDRVVAEHLNEAKIIAEKRASRSRLHRK